MVRLDGGCCRYGMREGLGWLAIRCVFSRKNMFMVRSHCLGTLERVDRCTMLGPLLGPTPVFHLFPIHFSFISHFSDDAQPCLQINSITTPAENFYAKPR